MIPLVPPMRHPLASRVELDDSTLVTLKVSVGVHRTVSEVLPDSNSNQWNQQLKGSNAGDNLTEQLYELQGSKNIFVYPFALNPEGSNPSGAVNFSKVSHAKLTLHMEPPKTDATAYPNDPLLSSAPGVPGASGADDGTKSPWRVDVYGLYYNWLQIKDGRALLSFA